MFTLAAVRRWWLVLIMLQLVIAALSGCKSNQAIKREWDAQSGKMQSESIPATPTPNSVLGKIVWHSKAEQRAVAYLAYNAEIPQTALMSRDYKGNITALLSPTAYTSGRALGLIVSYGSPNEGDELVLRSNSDMPENWEADNKLTNEPAQSFPFFIPEAPIGKTKFKQTAPTPEAADTAPNE